MRKLIVWNLMTLDGYFEGTKPWDIGFHTLVWGNDLEEFSRQQLGHECDLLVFGRKTYEGMAAYWTTAEEEDEIKTQMNGIAKICVSRSLTEATWNNTRLVHDPVMELTKLKQQPGKTIFIFGSAELVDSLLDAGLIDEIRLCLVPVVLGGGNPHFKPSGHSRPMALLEARPLENGGVILRYKVGAAA
ncbi:MULTISPECIES: dihydrofolate reductase family protein [unclassified Rhizobium]|uniref:dihydrofolate reductase family protein n=1 Tax=unclassified Rhizobium TaxID=2613769 RepID=UPI0006F36282|nr:MULTISPECIES: dihydrofolate reductase family protein [unclassified Rhizobium]KQV44037.1 riboflavin biosynthesis protein RibD [Rhizobium sp. Root1212]KRD38218.1 riboflavin biosynthesis protein RibD [Rhizobium sp. Root268]